MFTLRASRRGRLEARGRETGRSYDATVLKHYWTDGRPVICGKCEQRGCTVKDSNLYPCKSCTKEYGRTHFDTNQIKNFKHHAGPLICNYCRKKETDDRARAKRIQTALRLKGSWKCTCGQPIHHEKCDLSSTAGRRWPGKNKGVTEDDWKFLQEHTKKNTK